VAVFYDFFSPAWQMPDADKKGPSASGRCNINRETSEKETGYG
jgi:hypothetical protein